METKITRKEIQNKLNFRITEIVKSVIAADSKKIKKAIRKASRILAKAIARKIEDSDGQLTLEKKTEKTIPVAKRTIKRRKNVAVTKTTLPVKRKKPATPKIAQTKAVTKSETAVPENN